MLSKRWKQSNQAEKPSKPPQTDKTHPKNNPPLLPILAIVLRRKLKNSSLAVKPEKTEHPAETSLPS